MGLLFEFKTTIVNSGSMGISHQKLVHRTSTSIANSGTRFAWAKFSLSCRRIGTTIKIYYFILPIIVGSQ